MRRRTWTVALKLRGPARGAVREGQRVAQDGPRRLGIEEGDVLAGKYRVERVLGVGGMGVVVAAHHLQLDERVALKFLLPEALGDAEAVARFAREARAAVKIKSEHVARVIDVGTLRTARRTWSWSTSRAATSPRGCSNAAACPSSRPSSSCSRPARRSPRRTRSASCTAISSPRTSSCVRRARRAALDQGARLRHLEGDGADRPASGTARRAGDHARRPRSWARRSTCRPSRCARRRTSTRGRTSGRSASSSSSSSPAGRPFMRTR